MSSAPCASAPSHPLHAMPPRFTRNSHRPRASDRTMVDTEDTRDSLANFSRHDWRRHPRQMNPTGMANRPEPKPLARTERHSYRQWAGSREKIFSPPVEAELFFLTSLFIELIDPFLSVMAMIPTLIRMPLAFTPRVATTTKKPIPSKVKRETFPSRSAGTRLPQTRRPLIR